MMIMVIIIIHGICTDYTDWFICCVATLYRLRKLHSVIWAKYVYALWMWKGGRGSSYVMHKTDIFSWKFWGIPWKMLSGWLVGIWIKYLPDTNQMCCHRANLLRSNLVGGKMSVCLRWGELWHLSQSNYHMEFVQSNAIYIRLIFFVTYCVTMFYTLTGTV